MGLGCAAFDAGRARRAGGAASRIDVPGVSARHHCGRARGRGPAFPAGDENEDGHARARGRVEPRDGACHGRQHPRPLHGGVRRGRSLVRARGRAAWAAARGAGRDGREHSYPCLRGDRDRRHRLHPRRTGGLASRRHRGYHRPRIPADALRRFLSPPARERCRPGNRFRNDLLPVGGGAVLQAAGPLSRPRMKTALTRIMVVGALLVAYPLVMSALDNLFYVSFASRVLIYAIAATSLNLVLGYGGMISFGHAAFVGTGAYVASILMAEGIT